MAFGKSSSSILSNLATPKSDAPIKPNEEPSSSFDESGRGDELCNSSVTKTLQADLALTKSFQARLSLQEQKTNEASLSLQDSTNLRAGVGSSKTTKDSD